MQDSIKVPKIIILFDFDVIKSGGPMSSNSDGSPSYLTVNSEFHNPELISILRNRKNIHVIPISYSDEEVFQIDKTNKQNTSNCVSLEKIVIKLQDILCRYEGVAKVQFIFGGHGGNNFMYTIDKLGNAISLKSCVRPIAKLMYDISKERPDTLFELKLASCEAVGKHSFIQSRFNKKSKIYIRDIDEYDGDVFAKEYSRKYLDIKDLSKSSNNLTNLATLIQDELKLIDEEGINVHFNKLKGVKGPSTQFETWDTQVCDAIFDDERYKDKVDLIKEIERRYNLRPITVPEQVVSKFRPCSMLDKMIIYKDLSDAGSHQR